MTELRRFDLGDRVERAPWQESFPRWLGDWGPPWQGFISGVQFGADGVEYEVSNVWPPLRNDPDRDWGWKEEYLWRVSP